MEEVHIVGAIGRPKSDNPSHHKISIRLTAEEYRFLKQYVNIHDLTMTQAMKVAIQLLRDADC